MTFGQIIHNKRLEKEMALGDFAKKLGWTTVYVSDIEEGRRQPPSREKLLEMCSILGISREEVKLPAYML
ncbi:MAG: helix-turn-helix domain-containing protein [Leptospiraceae bacterium]|nr:helix-turn-helix domain-containing protein [Leptospiraceae bacterium]MCP5503416.1 helix-turn-helix domain-containing protein [Leptospiraceae bacterium]